MLRSTSQQSISRQAGPPLPELRQELRLLPGPHGDAVRSWLIYDPVRHRYFQVSHAAFRLLERWRAEPAEAFAARLTAELEQPVATQDVEAVARFLIANNLTLSPLRDDPRGLASQELATRRTLAGRFLHNYLFFKVPLLRPARALAATLPLVLPLYSRMALAILTAVTMIGLYLVSRQWDLFVTTFLDFFSFDGALLYGASLIAVKALHELGHAYTATRAGVRVNTMGVAFMVMVPILYTDVTDAWRLRDRRAKLAIDAAGVIVELAIAGIALFLWSFLPDGPMRSAAFATATTSLLLGLAVNLNPLMRFDGYYLLSDAWGIPNLQSRSFALARWALRRVLFDLDHPAPEPLPARTRRLLIGYALGVWVYRLFLFIGIALVVYHMVFKALGIVLFAVEIVWFILLPVVRELREWWSMRLEILSSRRSLVTAAVTAAAIAALVVPWHAKVTVQAVALAGLETHLYAPQAARIVSLSISDRLAVAAGDPLLVLEVPDLEHDVLRARRRITLVELRLSRMAGDEADRSNRIVLDGELARHRADLAGLEAEQRRLVVRSPHHGEARDIDRDLRPGDWIGAATPLGRIVSHATLEARGYLGEDDLWRISPGNAVHFIAEDPLLARRTGRVIEVVGTGVGSLDLVYLASVHGGAIPSDKSGDGGLHPRSGWHLVRVELDGPPVDRTQRGTLHIAAEKESLAAAIWRRILQVLVRESSA